MLLGDFIDVGAQRPRNLRGAVGAVIAGDIDVNQFDRVIGLLFDRTDRIGDDGLFVPRGDDDPISLILRLGRIGPALMEKPDNDIDERIDLEDGKQRGHRGKDDLHIALDGDRIARFDGFQDDVQTEKPADPAEELFPNPIEEFHRRPF